MGQSVWSSGQIGRQHRSWSAWCARIIEPSPPPSTVMTSRGDRLEGRARQEWWFDRSPPPCPCGSGRGRAQRLGWAVSVAWPLLVVIGDLDAADAG
jgi:hypothetical protein